MFRRDTKTTTSKITWKERRHINQGSCRQERKFEDQRNARQYMRYTSKNNKINGETHSFKWAVKQLKPKQQHHGVIPLIYYIFPSNQQKPIGTKR